MDNLDQQIQRAQAVECLHRELAELVSRAVIADLLSLRQIGAELVRYGTQLQEGMDE